MKSVITKKVTVAWSGLATVDGTAIVEVPADWTDEQILEHCNREMDRDDLCWDICDIESGTADGVGEETDDYADLEWGTYLGPDEEIASSEEVSNG